MANQTLVATATENSRSEPATNCFFHLEKKMFTMKDIAN